MAFALVKGSNRNNALQDSATFAHVAERFRRAGDLHRAVALCRDGLKRFPGHVSARVTLGLALLDLAQYSHARAELQQALKRAPDNLAAIRGLAQLHDHPDDSSHLDDAEDLQAQQRWRPVSPEIETSDETLAPAPLIYTPQPVQTFHPREAAVARESMPPLRPAPVAEIRPQPVRFEDAPLELPVRLPAPAKVAWREPVADPIPLDPPTQNWDLDPDLAAYNAALPIKMSLPAVMDLNPGDDVKGEPEAEFQKAAAPTTRRTDLIAAALERLLTQVTNQRLSA
jgi:tetratricopeptide (TPR) repeat protein